MRIDETYAYLCVHDTAAAIRFYGQAFGATEKFRLVEPSGRIGHAELAFGPHTVMLCDEFPECGIRSASSLGATPVTLHLHLHVDDADAMLAQAVAAGATLEREASDAFYGERSGVVRCPFGHRWLIGHAIEQVTPEEMQRRYTALFN
ncbi:VOC family protein [Hydrogenophaga borbori]|uniref:VOC family protein n=1 Tax=Hydrogenophaga borbori TaxID=2294117 RepID=A0A372EJ18_9BURK|nr:VOC family protein [Hydrogenophaga borbori]RFP78659.1 VOC family protein [Hydrogenophaga borbori]